MDLLCFCSVLCLLCLCARLFICALWSPAGKGLTSWLSFVVSTVSQSFIIIIPVIVAKSATFVCPDVSEMSRAISSADVERTIPPSAL